MDRHTVTSLVPVTRRFRAPASLAMDVGQSGGIRYSGTSSISANVGQGRGTLASSDGRNAGTPLAEGCSPSHNMDQHGPTSVLKSVSKLPTDEIVGGVLLNQK